MFEGRPEGKVRHGYANDDKDLNQDGHPFELWMILSKNLNKSRRKKQKKKP